MGDFHLVEAGLRVPRGCKAAGWLTFDGDLGDGLRVPVAVVNGRAGGPTLWLQAALHGDEYDGVVALLRWLEQTDPANLAGTVVVAPVLNVSGFRYGAAASPLDGRNLNRVFPGNDGGTWSERFAAWVMGLVERYADALLDLHGGGLYLEVVPFAFVAGGSPSGQVARALAAATGVRYLCLQFPANAGTLFAVLAGRGIPAVLVEAGGGPSWRPEAVESHLKAVDGALRQLGMLLDPSGASMEAPARGLAPLCVRATDLRARLGGVATARAAVGATVALGDLLLELRDWHGTVRERILCPVPRAVVLSIASSALVQPGAYAAMLGEEVTSAEC